MTKYTIVALAITAITLTPLAASAFADREEVENYCSQEATKKGVTAEMLDEEIAKCVAENMKAEKVLEEEEEEEGEGEEKK